MRTLCALFICLVLAGCQGGGLPSTPLPGNQIAIERAATVNAGTAKIVVALPLRNEAKLDAFLRDLSAPGSSQYHHFLTREAFAEQYGPRASDLQRVAEELARAGFTTRIGAQAVFARASYATIARYVHTSIDTRTYPTGDGDMVEQAVAHTTPSLSPLLRSLRARVIGLDAIPPASKFSVIAEDATLQPHNYNGRYGPYDVASLKQAYRWPNVQDLDGTGITMAVVIDKPIHESDLQYYARNVLGKSVRFTQVGVDGGGSWSVKGSGEATLDAEQSLGMAPGASETLYHVDTLGLQNLYDGYNAAYQNKRVSVVNSSFGACELNFYTSSGVNDLNAFGAVFKAGVAVGITWVASSGDAAAFDCPGGSSSSSVGVEWPAVDPFVVGVGGTNLTTTHAHNSYDSAYVNESAYAEPLGHGTYWGSGGGFSQLFARPSFQKGFVTNPGRGVPDIALQMGGVGFSGIGKCEAVHCNPNDSSDWLRIGGKWKEAIGTSASSPDIAGLIALRGQQQHQAQGDIHSWLYGHAGSAMFRSNIKGNNGYRTGSPWNPVLGVGTPFGNTFVGSHSVAGVPKTPSNP